MYTGYPSVVQLYQIIRSSRPKVFCKKSVLRNFTKFTGKYLCQRNPPNACKFIKKDSLVQVLSFEFYEISKNTFFYRTPPADISGLSLKIPYLRHHKETLYEKRLTKHTFLILPICSAVQLYFSITAQKIKFSIEDFFSIHIYWRNP